MIKCPKCSKGEGFSTHGRCNNCGQQVFDSLALKVREFERMGRNKRAGEIKTMMLWGMRNGGTVAIARKIEEVSVRKLQEVKEALSSEPIVATGGLPVGS